MGAEAARLVLPPFITDEGIPADVNYVLAELGYNVSRIREYVGPNTADATVALVVDDLGGIIVANDRHYKGKYSPVAREAIDLRARSWEGLS